ncbi:MAG TPA: hypothetical protein VIC05_06620 [Solirubrobacteraceae bacterium]|jgi:hypothetical protein
MSKGRKIGAATITSAVVAVAVLIVLSHGSRSVTKAAARSVSSSTPTPPAACGPASADAIAAVDGTVAERIYKGELSSRATSIDVAHITGSQELLSALTRSDQQAVYTAVHNIVYTPHWHIVRLLVTTNGGHPLADVGGPYIIAPVHGVLRFKGKAVGRFVMSVQDDLGYMKLITRFVGVPVDLYAGGSFVMGTLQPAPSSVSSGATFTRAGATYRELVLRPLAFPDGTLKVAMFIPTPARQVMARSCAEVRAGAWSEVIGHVAARFHPLSASYGGLVGTLIGSTGGMAYVREGSRALAGPTSPKRLPSSGTITFRGRSWSVSSWSPQPAVRVYLLTASS